MRLLLADLLGSPDLSPFFRDHWERLPFARPEGAAQVADLASAERLGALLADESTDIVAVRDGAPAEGGRPRSLEEARALLGTGATIAFRHLERSDPGFAALGRRMSAELRGAPNVHVYWTPPGHGSFGWHCDPEDVFLLQVHGRKRYRFRENTVHRWPLLETLAQAGSAAQEESPIGEAALEPGAWLYLPAGWWHDVLADTESIAISVGLLAPTPLDVLDFLRAELVRDERWRARLPALGHAVPGDEGEKLAAFRGALARMGAELAAMLGDERTQQRYLRQALLRAWGATPSRRPR